MDSIKTESKKYEFYWWGPLLIRFKISEETRKLFLDEANKSTADKSQDLAGILHKQVLFGDPKKFEKFFTGAFTIYQNAMKKWSDRSNNELYKLTDRWVNFQKANDFNPPHDHSGNLTFVIYLDIPDKLKEENKKYKGRSTGPGGITFLYGDGPREAITYRSFFPETGDMFIFPAWIKHWVFPFKSDCTRISVSGNVSYSVLPKLI